MTEFNRLTLCCSIILCCLSGPVVAQQLVREPAKKRWIIDPHTHFKGAEQIEWEARTTKRHPKNTLGHVITPEDYRSVADRLGIQSTVVVEAVEQDTPQFNDWLLEQAESDLISGYVARGNLLSPEFAANYERYKSSGYLRGFRFRQAELRGYLDHETARQHLQYLERDGMVVDLLVSSDHAESVMTLAREFPELTIVIDHCFGARLVGGKVSPGWTKAVNDCSEFPNVHCKLSSILNFSDAAPFGQPASVDLETYQPILETCFRAFGEDRVMFATNWAVCTHYGQVDDVVSIVTEFLKSKGEQALHKGMRENALRVFQIREEHLRPRENK
ncbi:amidohydrolase family protein [Rhodopirellula sp. JC740]|uniref:Amidohydrolase family protein n=1 Tax=Rhodopirellula halodulae TaxID=2894198 RepID=A0ABS8NHN7_9BACT|nr:amidohydrolase family protein [Rhodopirellula sp. JC740]